jgi:hypothetical protein
MNTNEEQKKRFPLRTKILVFISIPVIALLMWGALAGTAYVFGIPDKIILAVILAFGAWESLKEIEFRRAQNKQAHRNLAAYIERLEETIKKLQAEHLPRRVARLELLSGHGGLWPASEGLKEYMREHFKREEWEKRKAEKEARLDQEASALMKQGMNTDEVQQKLRELIAQLREESNRHADEKYRGWEREATP